MDQSLYKTATVNRGYVYRYYYSPPSLPSPTLLFLHGFPSSSTDWQYQVAHFQPIGFGIIALDMLGAGGTSKPLDPQAFSLHGMAADIIDLMDIEALDRVIGVAHDWGCVVMSYLSVLHQDRFHGFAWLGLSFMEPKTRPFDLDKVMIMIKDLLGYEGYAYWKFFEKEDAPEKIENNIDSFLHLLYPRDPECWRVWMALPGRTQQWIETGMQPGRPQYLTKEAYETLRHDILKNGIRSALNWYKCELGNYDLQQNLEIPREKWYITKPSFFAAALRDCLCTPIRGKASMAAYGREVTTVEFDTGHWVQLEAATQLNLALESWMKGLLLA